MFSLRYFWDPRARSITLYVGIFILNKNFFLMYIELSSNQHAVSNCMMFIYLFSLVANEECDFVYLL